MTSKEAYYLNDAKINGIFNLCLGFVLGVMFILVVVFAYFYQSAPSGLTQTYADYCTRQGEAFCSLSNEYYGFIVAVHPDLVEQFKGQVFNCSQMFSEVQPMSRAGRK